MFKKKQKPAAERVPLIESLEERQLFSSHHSVFTTRLTFTASPQNQVIGSSLSFPVAAKLTANGLPLRTAQILFVEDNASVVGFGTTGRSGYVTGNIAAFGVGKHTITAYFQGATRYTASQSGSYSATTTNTSLPATQTFPDGVKTTMLTAGTGAGIASGQTGTFTYIGMLSSNGITFDGSPSIGHSTFDLQIDSGRSIPGFNEGVKGMQLGELRLISIPAAQAYADQPPQGSIIPQNADLTFLVRLDAIS